LIRARKEDFASDDDARETTGQHQNENSQAPPGSASARVKECRG
jgi:hypothetical protein